MSMSKYLNKQDQIEQELRRLDQLSDLQLLQIFEVMDADPAPQWVKDAIARKINNIMNRRLGLKERAVI